EDAYQTVDEHWDLMLKPIEFEWNSSVHSVTQKSPHQLLFGKPISLTEEQLLKLTEGLKKVPHNDNKFKRYIENQNYLLRQNRREARRNQKHYLKIKNKYFNKNKKIKEFRIGDKVMLWEGRKRLGKIPGNINRFGKQYVGPFTVVEKLSNKKYRIKDPKTQKTYDENV